MLGVNASPVAEPRLATGASPTLFLEYQVDDDGQGHPARQRPDYPQPATEV
jgi:hypothetical protein